MEKQVFQFVVNQNLSSSNSFGIVKQEDNVELQVIIGINSETYGWFELYDIESEGSEWYAEGSLKFENKKVVGYDGVFCLPQSVIDKLRELGYTYEDVEC